MTIAISWDFHSLTEKSCFSCHGVYMLYYMPFFNTLLYSLLCVISSSICLYQYTAFNVLVLQHNTVVKPYIQYIGKTSFIFSHVNSLSGFLFFRVSYPKLFSNNKINVIKSQYKNIWASHRVLFCKILISISYFIWMMKNNLYS